MSKETDDEELKEAEEEKEIKRETTEKVMVFGSMALALVATLVTGGIAPLAIAAVAVTMNLGVIPLKAHINKDITGKHRNMVKATIASNSVRRAFEFSEVISHLGKHAYVFGAVLSVLETIALPLAAFALVASAISFSTAIIAHKKNPSLANKCAATGCFMTMLASGASVGLGIAAIAVGAALVANPITGPAVISLIVTASLVKASPYIYKSYKKSLAPKMDKMKNKVLSLLGLKTKQEQEEVNKAQNKESLEETLDIKTPKHRNELSSTPKSLDITPKASGPTASAKASLEETASDFSRLSMGDHTDLESIFSASTGSLPGPSAPSVTSTKEEDMHEHIEGLKVGTTHKWELNYNGEDASVRDNLAQKHKHDFEYEHDLCDKREHDKTSKIIEEIKNTKSAPAYKDPKIIKAMKSSASAPSSTNKEAEEHHNINKNH